MRVLFLHGYAQNKYKYKVKTRAITSCFSENDELIFLDGPIEVDSEDDNVFVNHPKSFEEVYPGGES
ncbi:hypothetical protein AYI69_g10545 [Smittium culicis]|uniref:Serine hydrolase domain-containing protein n=1 Tax=Smittium culicis TaxID=133412 RepID=A0A1R1X500_9FUNG|nr:hypothetical protein AYI69_g10545 [Smittium culicis]